MLISLDQVSLSVNSLRGLCEFEAAYDVRKIECVKWGRGGGGWWDAGFVGVGGRGVTQVR